MRPVSFRVYSGTGDIRRLFAAYGCTTVQLGSDRFGRSGPVWPGQVGRPQQDSNLRSRLRRAILRIAPASENGSCPRHAGRIWYARAAEQARNGPAMDRRGDPVKMLPAALSEDRTAAFHDDGSAVLVGDRFAWVALRAADC